MSGEGQGFGRFASNFVTFRGSTVFGRQDRGRARFDCERFSLCEPFSWPYAVPRVTDPTQRARARLSSGNRKSLC